HQRPRDELAEWTSGTGRQLTARSSPQGPDLLNQIPETWSVRPCEKLPEELRHAVQVRECESCGSREQLDPAGAQVGQQSLESAEFDDDLLKVVARWFGRMHAFLAQPRGLLPRLR